jgi:hypothetical protein
MREVHLREGLNLYSPSIPSRVADRSKLVGRAKLRLSRDRGWPGIFSKILCH